MGQIDDKAIGQRIRQNNKWISQLLQENEWLYSRLSADAAAPKPEEQIGFPTGVISTLSSVQARYHLETLIPDEIVRKNVSYCLEVCDLYAFMTDRFAIYGPVRAMVYKYRFFCLVSVIEALVVVAAKALGVGDAPRKDGKEPSFRDLINRKEFREKTGLTKEDKDQLHLLYNDRNRGHLTNPKENELTEQIFTPEKIAEAEAMLQYLADVLNRVM